MTRFAGRRRGGAIWVSYDGCSEVASSSPTGAPAGARSSGPAGCVRAWRSSCTDGREDLEVVARASYQDNLWRIVGGRRSPDGRVREDVFAVLAAEPDNPYDANAVAVWTRA